MYGRRVEHSLGPPAVDWTAHVLADCFRTPEVPGEQMSPEDACARPPGEVWSNLQDRHRKVSRGMDAASLPLSRRAIAICRRTFAPGWRAVRQSAGQLWVKARANSLWTREAAGVPAMFDFCWPEHNLEGRDENNQHSLSGSQSRG